MSFEAHADSRRVEIAMQTLAEALPEQLAARVLEAAQHTAGECRVEVMETFPSGKTGALPRSFRETFLGSEGGVHTAAAFSDLIYARILDEGGTILPKSVRKLAVPLSSANIPIGKWPRHWGKDELKLIPRRNGGAILATVSGRGRVQPKYVLVDKVQIDGRHYLERAAARAQPGIEEIIQGGVETAADEAAGGGG